MLSVSGMAGAPDPSVTPALRELKTAWVRTLDAPFVSFFGNAKSDDRGAVYLHPATTNYNDSLVVEISQAVSQPTIYSLPPEYSRRMAFYSFDVTPSGTVFLLSQDTDHRYVLFEFSRNGDLQRNTALELPISAIVQTFTVVESSELVFVSGYYGENAAKDMRGKAFAVLANSSGVVRSSVAITDNVDLKTVQLTVPEAASCASSNGEIYLLTGALIRVLDASGKVARTLKVQKPRKGLAAVNLMVSDGIGSITLNDSDSPDGSINVFIETLDLHTGKVLGFYHPTGELESSLLVSFSHKEGWLFYGNDSGKVRLSKAKVP
jgi:hypothetical protein